MYRIPVYAYIYTVLTNILIYILIYLYLYIFIYIYITCRCRKQVVSFAVSALGDVDVFGDNSQLSSMNLLLVLSSSGDGSSGSSSGSSGGNEIMIKTNFIQDITDELHSQGCFEAVAGGLLGMCYEGLNTTSTTMNMMSPPISIFETHHQPALTVLLLLLQADKRYLKYTLSGSLPHFRLSMEILEQYKLAIANNTSNTLLPPNSEQMGSSYYMQCMRGVCGCAMEHQTYVGRLLRVAPDVTLRVSLYMC